MIIAYLDTPSAYVVARQIGVSQQTVTRCLERAAELGVLAALDDRPRAGRDAVITREARAWLVSLACAKPIASGYPHELSTTRLLAAHARNHGPQADHPSLAKLAQGTVCKILAAHEIKPHKIRYYVERRDPGFEPKMAEVLCLYREVEMQRAAPADRDGGGEIAILSYDEKPGIQAIGNTTPDLPPVPGTHPTTQRDHEYKRHGTVTLMAGIDLLTDTVHALVKDRHRSREFIEFLKILDTAYPAATAVKVILDNHSAHHLAGDQDVAGRSANDRLRRRVGVLRPSSAQSRLRGPLAEEVGQRVLTGPFRRVVSVLPPGLRNGEKLDAVISRPGRFDRWPVAAAAELGRDAAFVVRRAPDTANQQKSARLC